MLKLKVYAACQEYIQKRIEAIEHSLEQTRTSALEETKSSAGDKYETGRAMMQLEVEKLNLQLTEAMKVKQALTAINPAQPTETIQPGSLVTTDLGTFFIAISAGNLSADERPIIALSPASPLGSKLLKLKKGSTFSHGGKTYTIHLVE